MSVYPGSIDSDATLYVSGDRIQTSLISAQAASDTVAVVSSTTGWVAYMIATIESEQQLVTGVVGSNTLNVTRAFGGTTAVAHGSGKTVSNFVDSAYQLAAKQALIAIETALGTNLSNVLSGVPPIFFGPTAGTGIPGVDNPYTQPNTLSVRDGTVASPQASSASPSVVFDRVNALVSNIASAFAFAGSSVAAANADLGVIVASMVIYDQTVARSGTAARFLVYGDKPNAIAAIASATIVGADIIIVTTTPHYGLTGNTAQILGSSGITSLNANHVITAVDTATQFRIAVGALTGGPASGGTANILTGKYASWDDVFKFYTGQRMVGCESDFNNFAGDAGDDVSSIDATFNYAAYATGNPCSACIYIDSGDVGTGRFYFPLKFGQYAVMPNYPYIDTTRNSNGYAADFAWIGNSQYIRWADNTVQGNTQAGKWPIIGVDNSNNTHLSCPVGGVIGMGVNFADTLEIAATKITAAKPTVLTPVAFGSLPAASTMPGALASVTDSTTVVWGATITGGGGNPVLAFSNGTNWTVAGK